MSNLRNVQLQTTNPDKIIEYASVVGKCYVTLETSEDAFEVYMAVFKLLDDRYFEEGQLWAQPTWLEFEGCEISIDYLVVIE